MATAVSVANPLHQAFGATKKIWAPNSDIGAAVVHGLAPRSRSGATRLRDLGIWAPLIDPQQVEPASVAPRSSGRRPATYPSPNCRSTLVVLRWLEGLHRRAGAGSGSGSSFIGVSSAHPWCPETLGWTRTRSGLPIGSFGQQVPSRVDGLTHATGAAHADTSDGERASRIRAASAASITTDASFDAVSSVSDASSAPISGGRTSLVTGCFQRVTTTVFITRAHVDHL